MLIYGGTGAVGTLAIQFASNRQGRVLATASGQDATALVLGLGAEAAIDPRHEDPVERLRLLAPMASTLCSRSRAARRSSDASPWCAPAGE